MTALQLAAELWFDGGVHLLLEAGADPNIATTDEGLTAMHFACRLCEQRTNPLSNGMSVLTQLLNAGCDIDAVDKQGCTPLFYAVYDQQYGKDLVEFLLQYDANVNHQDGHKRTVFMIAAQWGYVDVVKFLLTKRDMRSNLRDEKGRTALHWAVACNAVECAMAMGKAKKCLVSVQANDGDTPLHLACRDGSRQLAEFLLEGCDSECRMALIVTVNQYGNTAFDVAVASNNLDCADLLRGYLSQLGHNTRSDDLSSTETDISPWTTPASSQASLASQLSLHLSLPRAAVAADEAQPMVIPPTSSPTSSDHSSVVVSENLSMEAASLTLGNELSHSPESGLGMPCAMSTLPPSHSPEHTMISMPCGAPLRPHDYTLHAPLASPPMSGHAPCGQAASHSPLSNGQASSGISVGLGSPWAPNTPPSCGEASGSPLSTSKRPSMCVPDMGSCHIPIVIEDFSQPEPSPPEVPDSTPKRKRLSDASGTSLPPTAKRSPIRSPESKTTDGSPARVPDGEDEEGRERRRKQIHREYMRAKRQEERDFVLQMEKAVTDMETEHSQLSAAVMHARMEKQLLEQQIAARGHRLPLQLPPMTNPASMAPHAAVPGPLLPLNAPRQPPAQHLGFPARPPIPAQPVEDPLDELLRGFDPMDDIFGAMPVRAQARRYPMVV